MIFSDWSTCSMCREKLGIGVKRGWGWDGFIYCSKCIKIRDGEMKREYDEKKKAKKDGTKPD